MPKIFYTAMESIKDIALAMRTKKDLLRLINILKEDELREDYHLYTLKQLMWFRDPDHVFHRYCNFEIPKKSGGMRQISAPYSQSYKHLLRYVGMILQSIYEPSVHTMGFVPGKSIVDNARAHVGMNYVFNIDLKDFFPSLNIFRIAARLQARPFCFTKEVARNVAGLCTMRVEADDSTPEEKKYCYVLPQGSPASPVITNLMCEKLDFLLSGVAKRFGLVYTRYADDITFSSLHNVYQDGSDFRKELERIIEGQGFIINPKKTRLNVVGFRQEITGLTVSKDKVNVARKYIKDLRGLLYIWEKYGYAEAERRLREHKKYPYLHYTCRKRGTSLANVVEGKIAFLKMVKGESDSTYLKLLERYHKLMHESYKNQPLHTGILYRETYTLSQFEQKHQTIVEFHQEEYEYATKRKKAGEVHRYAKFLLNKKEVWAEVKLTADISLPKEKLCISFCEKKDGTENFWLIHEPYKSQRFKEKVNIDQLNEELDALLSHG